MVYAKNIHVYILAARYLQRCARSITIGLVGKGVSADCMCCCATFAGKQIMQRGVREAPFATDNNAPVQHRPAPQVRHPTVSFVAVTRSSKVQ